MSWNVLFCDEFDAEFEGMAEGLQDELLAHALLLREFGPGLGRPTVDTLKGSKHPNMKELRFNWNGEVWRVAFAFDPKRQAVLLVGGDKASADQKRFYKRLIVVADERYNRHLSKLPTSVPGGKGTRHGKKS
ncbi:MAG: type II toxin-antitoxin system RelE/ParE family toxin [Desulfuromonadales bacterium]|nr:type II toxin-antitoxin system RelE/ParE family toxin [Desulfuromonadales bacterium]